MNATHAPSIRSRKLIMERRVDRKRITTSIWEKNQIQTGILGTDRETIFNTAIPIQDPLYTAPKIRRPFTDLINLALITPNRIGNE